MARSKRVPKDGNSQDPEPNKPKNTEPKTVSPPSKPAKTKPKLSAKDQLDELAASPEGLKALLEKAKEVGHLPHQDDVDDGAVSSASSSPSLPPPPFKIPRLNGKTRVPRPIPSSEEDLDYPPEISWSEARKRRGSKVAVSHPLKFTMGAAYNDSSDEEIETSGELV